jgi:hypothetical protein
MRRSVRMLTTAVSIGVWWHGVTPLTEVPGPAGVERAPPVRKANDGKRPDPLRRLVGGTPHAGDHPMSKPGR